MLDVFLFLLGIFLGSLGAIFLKLGSTSISEFSFSLNGIKIFLWNINIIAGLILYFIPAMIWIYLLSKYPVSYIQPMLSLTYVFTPVFALIILQEKIPCVRWIGIAVIILGVFLISRR